jgi:phosphatidylglycerophosphate synthase
MTRADDIRAALARLGGAQKTAKGAPAYSRFVNRRIGRWFAAVLYTFGWTPNQVTSLSAVFTFSGIALVALVRPAPWVGLVVCLLLVIGYALDSADGQLARLRGGGSPAGEWLDHVVDSVKTTTIHAAVLIGLYRYGGFETATPLLVPLAFGVVSVVFFSTVLLTDQLRRAWTARVGTKMPDSGTPASVLRSLLVLPNDYGVLCLVFLTWGWSQVFLVVYGLLLLGFTLFLALALPAWFREVRTFSEPA